MNAEAISVRGLKKTYGGREVLDGVTFSVPSGSVVGLLGPNGSGKSTTVRILLGLAAADAGEAEIAGSAYSDLSRPGHVVGMVGESLGLHPRHTARQHLRILAAADSVPMSRVDELLTVMGLGDAADRRISTYSLGMRQRVGMAAALLAQPDVLVLDEPSNGLDPEGIIWLRGLIRQFVADGGAVLLTSHVLSELERVVDAVVILNEGKVVATRDPVGAKDDLEAFYLEALGRGPVRAEVERHRPANEGSDEATNQGEFR